MQSLLYLNLLLLILIFLFCISSISFSYTDLYSSRLLHSVTASKLANLSVSTVLYRTVLYSDMAPKTRISRRKRSIAALGCEGTSRESEIDCHNDLQESNEVLRGDGVNVKKKLCIGIETENIIVENADVNLFFYGHASYQNKKRGVSVEYKDLGDVYRCFYCNAYFWSDEAKKRTSRNAPIIYTGCCQEGQVRLSQPNPTPKFLDELLDARHGQKSVLFRENIRIYNSMFAFTSMGAKIDYNIILKQKQAASIFCYNDLIMHKMH